jgi:hypothetical protein
MILPCAKPLAFIVTGLSFLKPALTNIQFKNMALVATALVLGSGFNLSRISRMWLEDKVVSTLSFVYPMLNSMFPSCRCFILNEFNKSMNDLAYQIEAIIETSGGLSYIDLDSMIDEINRIPMGAIDYKIISIA